jgi:hypothetical protein
MTSEELEEMMVDCPILYHMAERGSWPSIQRLGLFSTSGLLDLYKVTGEAREKLESMRRPRSVKLELEGLPGAVVRDQIPMDDAGLKRCLPSHIQPSDWYKILNNKVFFWLTKSRLLRLLGAGAYRNMAHDVLEVDTRKLIDVYYRKIWLSPMNSGTTKPVPHPRGEDTFQRIESYPYAHWRVRRTTGERAVELAVDYSVPDISEYVYRVVEMKGDKELKVIYS